MRYSGYLKDARNSRRLESQWLMVVLLVVLQCQSIGLEGFETVSITVFPEAEHGFPRCLCGKYC